MKSTEFKNILIKELKNYDIQYYMDNDIIELKHLIISIIDNKILVESNSIDLLVDLKNLKVTFKCIKLSASNHILLELNNNIVRL
ncbi:hypothetical protein EOM09_08055 [bacterium]|nr:hypothetical protein [bacterium]